MSKHALRALLAICPVVPLAACGGSGGGGIASAPAPAPAPVSVPVTAPLATPTPPPIPPGPIGLQSAQPFKTYGAWTDGWGSMEATADAVRISYSASESRYTVSLPGYQEGKLLPTGGNGSFNESGWINLASTVSDLTDGAGPETQYVIVTLAWPGTSKYSYTSFGRWSGALPMGHNDGVFAYGTPTGARAVPITGSASYNGEIRGLTNGEPFSPTSGVGPVLDVVGTVSLSFDFRAGTLSGEMKPQLAPIWDLEPLGT